MAFPGHRWQFHYRTSIAICQYLIRKLSSRTTPESVVGVYLNDIQLIESQIDQLNFNSACEHAEIFIGKVQSDLTGGAINQTLADELIESCTRLTELLRD